MIKEVVGTLFLIVFVAILYRKNPNENQFKEYLKEKITKEAYKESEVKGVVIDIIYEPLSSLSEQTTKRKDYLLFSKYSVRVLGKNRTYAGLFDTFFEI